MHEGGDKSPVPRNWQLYDKGKYRAVTRLFQDYLATCYSTCYAFTSPQCYFVHYHTLAQEERDARKLPSGLDSLISMDAFPDDIDNNDVDEPEATEINDAVPKKAKNARPTTGRKSKKRARESSDENLSEHSTDADSDDSSGTDSDDEGDNTTNRRRRPPLPFSAPKVDYVYINQTSRRAVPQSTHSRPKPRMVKRKKSHMQATPPSVEGKSTSIVHVKCTQ